MGSVVEMIKVKDVVDDRITVTMLAAIAKKELMSPDQESIATIVLIVQRNCGDGTGRKIFYMKILHCYRLGRMQKQIQKFVKNAN